MAEGGKCGVRVHYSAHRNGGQLLTVDMVGTALVMARNKSIEEGNSVGIRRLKTTESSGVDDGLVVRVTIARIVQDTTINTLENLNVNFRLSKFIGEQLSGFMSQTYSGVTAPEIDPEIGHGFAGLNINNLDSQPHLDTTLTIGDILSDLLATDV